MILLILVCALLIIDIALFSYEQYGWSLIVLVASCAAGYYMIPEVAALVDATTAEVLAYYIGAYLLAGVAVATVKWLAYVRNIGSDLSEVRKTCPKGYVYTGRIYGDNVEFNNYASLAAYIIDKASRTEQPSLSRFIRNEASTSENTLRGIDSVEALINAFMPSARKNVDRITYWLVLWPFVLIDLVLNDIIAKLGKHLATLFNKLFGRLTRFIITSAIGNIEEQFAEVPATTAVDIAKK